MSVLGAMGAALGVLLVVGIASAAVLSVFINSTRPQPQPRTPPRVSRAFVIHDALRSDRADNALSLVQLASTVADKAHMWPAIMPARDPTARAAFEACPTPRLLVGEFGATASHIAALEHALASDPELLHPAAHRWVLVFEDDALPRLPRDRVAARINAALGAAAQRHIDAVFFGWFYEHKVQPLVRVDATTWRAPAPLSAIAYALRGSALPGILALLKQRRCTVPVDCVYSSHLGDVLLATRSRDAVPGQRFLRDALFQQLATPSSIAKRGEARTSSLGAAKRK
jgi:hypothetical protein